MQAGAVDFVEKPVKQDAFTDIVMRHLPDMWANLFNAFLLANYGNASLTFDDLRRHFRFSRSYGSAQFKKHLGKSFRARLREIRVEKAKYLLDETELQLQEISYQCGFRAQARLTEAFRAFYGVTPSEYRKKQT